MVYHFIPTKAWADDDGVKALQPVLDGSQGLIIDFLLLIFCQLHPNTDQRVIPVACTAFSQALLWC